MTPRSRGLQLPNGARLHMLEWDGESPPVVFIHGLGNTAGVWREIAGRISPAQRSVAIDLRGHGDSDHDPSGYSLDTFAADITAALHLLDDAPVTVVGHSLGGKVAVVVAAQAPELVSGVVIVDSGPRLARPGVQQLLANIEKVPYEYDSVLDYRDILELWYPLADARKLDQLVADELRRRPGGGWVRKLDPRFNDSDFVRASTGDSQESKMWELLKRVAQPTLVVRGIASAMLTKEVAIAMTQEFLPNGSLVTVGRSGHAVPVENPEGLGQQIEQFLARFRHSAA